MARRGGVHGATPVTSAIDSLVISSPERPGSSDEGRAVANRAAMRQATASRSPACGCQRPSIRTGCLTKPPRGVGGFVHDIVRLPPESAHSGRRRPQGQCRLRRECVLVLPRLYVGRLPVDGCGQHGPTSPVEAVQHGLCAKVEKKKVKSHEDDRVSLVDLLVPFAR